jgi:hypothetical protein
MNSKKLLLAGLLVFAAIPSLGAQPTITEQPSLGEMNNHTKISIATKFIKNSFAVGNLFGLNYMHYESEYFFVGGAAYTGQLSNGAIGNYSEGGILVGYQWPISKKVNLLGETLFGGAGGSATTTSSAVNSNGAGLILSPAFGVDTVLGKRTRGVLDIGYLWMPSTTSYSGLVAEIRIDFVD